MNAKLRSNSAPPLKRVLLVGDHTGPSSPILSLASELNRLGVETLFSGDTIWTDTKKWLTLALRSQVIVLVQYHHDSRFLERQLHRARLLGCVVVRWWVGSDVMFCRESERKIRAAKALNEAVDLNIAVSPHLVTELEEIEIYADYLPSPCNLTTLESEPPSVLPSAILAYLPTERRAFYGEKVLVAAIEANPQLTFIVVNDESHSLEHYPNVESLGWVEDMESVWSRVGLLLRVTEHDGMPRMVLEALSRGRYVIYSEVFGACWYGRSAEEVLRHLDHFKSLTEPNHDGPEIVKSIAGDAASRYVSKMAEQCGPIWSVKRLLIAFLAAKCIISARKGLKPTS